MIAHPSLPPLVQMAQNFQKSMTWYQWTLKSKLLVLTSVCFRISQLGSKPLPHDGLWSGEGEFPDPCLKFVNQHV